MKLLLDTHIALWAVTEPERLTQKTRNAIIRPDNDIWVSIAALWEIAIKRSSGRVRGDIPILPAKEAMLAFGDADFDLLGITPNHVDLVEFLPRHHGDPFDRLMVAQAKGEAMTLLTHDKTLAAYGDFVMVV